MLVGQLDAELIARAVEVFAREAYGDRGLPPERRHLLELRTCKTLDQLLSVKGVERLRASDSNRTDGFAIRVGRPGYPPMKMTLLPYGDTGQYVVGVDTHDNVDLPVNAPDYEEFQKVRQVNQQLATGIERAFEKALLPTQASMLKEFLRRRREGETPAGDLR